MYTLIISAVIAAATLLALGLPEFASWGWSVFWAILVFFASNGLIGFFISKKIKAMMKEMEGIMLDGQRRMQVKTQAWRFRPPGSVKQAQNEIFKMQHQFIEKALEYSKKFEAYKRWSPLLTRQIATMRMQLNFQDRNYKEVDALLPKCLMLDYMTVSIAIARVYQRDGYKKETDKKGNPVPNAVDRYFNSGVKKLQYGQGALLYGLYAWILIKENDIDGAFKVLLKASEKMENETIKHNIELLKNNKIKHFSLAGLGDEWYALGLEEPRIKMQRVQRPY